MSEAGEKEVVVYRSGALTPDNFTPRPEKDTTAPEGQHPGLSALTLPDLGGGRKYQGIDLAKLKPPLKAFWGEPEGHVTIAPADASGDVDRKALEEWASYRKSNRTHPLTQRVLDAITEPEVRFEK